LRVIVVSIPGAVVITVVTSDGGRLLGLLAGLSVICLIVKGLGWGGVLQTHGTPRTGNP
jgi:hypothetical protein